VDKSPTCPICFGQVGDLSHMSPGTYPNPASRPQPKTNPDERSAIQGSDFRISCQHLPTFPRYNGGLMKSSLSLRGRRCRDSC
jgi:hypothetical protein